MKILFVNCFYWPDTVGGAERSVKRLVDLHVKAGDQVSVLTTHAGPGIRTDIVDGVTVTRLPPNNIYWAKQFDQPVGWKRLLWHSIDSFNAQTYRQTTQIIRDLQPDIISCHNLAGLSVSVWAAALRSRIPVVQVLRDYYTLCPRSTMFRDGHNCVEPCASCRSFRLPHARLSNRLSAVIGCSAVVLSKHLKFGMYRKVPIQKVIYNAEAIAPVAHHLTAFDQPFTFGYIGSISEVKGITEMILAFENARKSCKRKIRLVLAGSGHTEFVYRLKKRFESENIQFIGHTEPKILFEQTDATIVPSVWDDPLPGVAFQALAHGLPVIAANRGGIPEIIKHEINGLIYDPASPLALEQAIKDIANNPNLHEKLASNAHQSANHFLDETRLHNEYKAVYSQLMQK